MTATDNADFAALLANIEENPGDKNAVNVALDYLEENGLMESEGEGLQFVKRVALARHIGESLEEIEGPTGGGEYEYGNESYLVLTDAEADERFRKSVIESVWMRDTAFLMGHINIKATGRTFDKIRKALKKLQEDLCEDANPLLLAMLEDEDAFVRDVQSADGRGHTLSPYDGEENEETVRGVTLYIYRQ